MPTDIEIEGQIRTKKEPKSKLYGVRLQHKSTQTHTKAPKMLLPTSLSLSPCCKASVSEVYQPVLYLEIANEKFLYKVTTGPARGIIQN